PCALACDTFVACAAEVCEGLDAATAGALRPGCLDACAGNPAFATVVNGAGGCQTVVDFGRDQSPAFAEACAAPMDAPTPCQVPADCGDPQRTCRDGLCRPVQFAQCRDDGDCDTEVGQTCRSFSANPLDPGNCHIDCAADAGLCPLNQECIAAYGDICYFGLCGGGTQNGAVFEACRVAGRDDGVCYPQAEGNRTPQGLPGICLEGGEAPLGAPCDAQAATRSAEDVALRCQVGVCIGDPDDPNEPAGSRDGRGTCVALCDPNNVECGEGTTCIDFSAPDDPMTPQFDETVYIGACMPSDCSVLADPAEDCGEGRACRPYAATTDAGVCGPAGEGAPGSPCAVADECLGNQICGGEGVCIPMCDPGAADPAAACAEGQICYAEATWAIGFCIADPMMGTP
ncbi:MAG: hypothetical protein KC613_28295, partial [Myxococcales bacterium]|nr:hypothetical protein [Myxococcales bacterium]